ICDERMSRQEVGEKRSRAQRSTLPSDRSRRHQLSDAREGTHRATLGYANTQEGRPTTCRVVAALRCFGLLRLCRHDDDVLDLAERLRIEDAELEAAAGCRERIA